MVGKEKKKRRDEERLNRWKATIAEREQKMEDKIQDDTVDILRLIDQIIKDMNKTEKITNDRKVQKEVEARKTKELGQKWAQEARA